MHELQLRYLIDSLRDPRLLSPDRFGEVMNLWIPQCRELSVITAELAYRGWLTPYQIKTILRDQTRSLFCGSYIFEDVIGEGGMGIVYRARNWKLDKIVAIKVARPEKLSSAKQSARFIREIQALAELNHPHIIEAIDAGVVENRLYFVMEYVAGGDLGNLVNRLGPISVADACLYAVQVTDALQYLSSQGIVHRDVKPGNLLLSADGKQIKLLDMGLARLLKGTSKAMHPALTGTGTLLGTPEYIAPEQVSNPSATDIRSDLYSLGCTLYHLLTGTPPFVGQSTVELLHKHVSHTASPISNYRNDVPEKVTQTIERLLRKRPRDRFSEPAELVGELLPFVHDEIYSTVPVQLSEWAIASVHAPPLDRTVEFQSDELRVTEKQTRQFIPH